MSGTTDVLFTVESGGQAVGKVAGIEVLDAQVILAPGGTIETSDLLVNRATNAVPASGVANGTLSIVDTSLVTDTLRVGESGFGEVAVRAGATLDLVTESPLNVIGGAAGSHGSVTVDQGGLFRVGERVGLVLGDDGGQTRALGTLDVSGGGTRFQGLGELVAGNSGEGRITVSDGASFSAPDLVLGAAAQGLGTLSVSGAGSRAEIGNGSVGNMVGKIEGVVDMANRLLVGNAGEGRVSVTDGATLNTLHLIAALEENSRAAIAVGQGATLNADFLAIGGDGSATLDEIGRAHV
jgi:T5SS/PEP-CTERM-associated repeat protein